MENALTAKLVSTLRIKKSQSKRKKRFYSRNSSNYYLADKAKSLEM